MLRRHLNSLLAGALAAAVVAVFAAVPAQTSLSCAGARTSQDAGRAAEDVSSRARCSSATTSREQSFVGNLRGAGRSGRATSRASTTWTRATPSTWPSSASRGPVRPLSVRLRARDQPAARTRRRTTHSASSGTRTTRFLFPQHRQGRPAGGLRRLQDPDRQAGSRSKAASSSRSLGRRGHRVPENLNFSRDLFIYAVPLTTWARSSATA